MKTEELKPCPFCGGEAEIISDREALTLYKIECQGYGCFCATAWHVHKKEATLKWNRREQQHRCAQGVDMNADQLIGMQEVVEDAKANALRFPEISLDDLEALVKLGFECLKLREENEQLQADSKRLDFLISHSKTLNVRSIDGEYQPKTESYEVVGYKVVELYWVDGVDQVSTGSTPREAIDNLMAAGEQA